MRIDLPLQVLSLMGPILSWVEGMEGLSFPPAWMVDYLSPGERERAWLVRELPTYSFDTVDEVRSLSRQRSSGRAPKARRPELSPPPDYDLSRVFDELCERYFIWNGGTVCVRQGRMEELHELSLRFPVGHLIRHDHARASSRGWISEQRALDLPEQVNLLPTNSYPLRTIVQRGLSEGHLHLMGVTSAEESWADSLLKHVNSDTLEGFQPTERRLLLLSRYAARVLALGIRCVEDPRQGGRLPFHLLARLDEAYFARNRYEELEARGRLRASYQQTLRGGGGRSLWPLHPLLQRPPGLEWLLDWIDPLAARLWDTLHAPHGLALQEPRTLVWRSRRLEQLHLQAHRTLVGLERGTPRHHFLNEILFRYLVFRTHHWQLATQYGKTTGLRYFKRFYDSRQRRPLDAEPAATKRLIFDRLHRWPGLDVLEGRVSPPEGGAGELEPWLVAFAEGAGKPGIRKFGLVVHFIKAEQGGLEERATLAGYPSLRHGAIRRTTREKAFDLFRLLSHPHPAVPFIVGVDAANLELTTPPEVFAPAFRFLRNLPIEPRTRADPAADHYRIAHLVRRLTENRRLGMTYHVGEDFRHLLSGLRAIDEVLVFLDSQPGDRLGHGIALGILPETWAEQSGYQAVLPRLEWLDTLVWVHHLVGPGFDLIGELGVEDWIQRLAWAVYGPPRGKGGGPRRGRRFPDLDGTDVSPLTLYDAWRLRQLDPSGVEVRSLADGCLVLRQDWSPSSQRRRWEAIQRDVAAKVEAEVGTPDAYRLLLKYWFDPRTRRCGAEPILCDMQPEREKWIRLCHEVQRRMIERVHRRQVVVEVNPSVNRVIGPMSRLDQHHVFRLTLGEDKRLRREVRVTVNTDNPAVFNTSLAHEYYLLGENLIRQGVPEPEVVEWLGWLRDNGKEYSFVRQLPGRDDPDMRKILGAVQEARGGYRGVPGREAKYRLFRRRQDELLATRSRRGGSPPGAILGSP